MLVERRHEDVFGVAKLQKRQQIGLPAEEVRVHELSRSREALVEHHERSCSTNTIQTTHEFLMNSADKSFGH